MAAAEASTAASAVEASAVEASVAVGDGGFRGRFADRGFRGRFGDRRFVGGFGGYYGYCGYPYGYPSYDCCLTY
jgi:hypothetical protein